MKINPPNPYIKMKKEIKNKEKGFVRQLNFRPAFLWEKEIQTGYEKLIAIIHEAHDNGLIFGRLYKKFGDTFNEIVRSHLNSRELPPVIGVSQVIEMVEGMKQECVPDGDNDDLRPYNQALDEVINKLKR